jgi:hypothetical protein
MTDNEQIASYLTALRVHLASHGVAEQDEIAREIETHIRDSVENSVLSVGAVLERLGSPQELADQYREGFLVGKASRRLSPLVLLRGSLRWSAGGLFGILAFVVGLAGYFLGVGLVLFGLIVPVWILTHRALHPPASLWTGMASALLLCLIGGLMLLLTTLFMRASLRTFQRWQSPL